MSFTLEALDERLRQRATASADESYTARLLAAGTEKCARKFGEPA
jgi:phosphoribosyl-ATP pyrophosphohydrolase